MPTNRREAFHQVLLHVPFLLARYVPFSDEYTTKDIVYHNTIMSSNMTRHEDTLHAEMTRFPTRVTHVSLAVNMRM